MTSRSFFMWLVLIVASTMRVRTADAQISPTGVHYAGRPSDTGHIGPNDNGGYSVSIPLELPASRDALPIPLQVVSGTKGFGAAGVGWDVPLSYVLVDRSFAHRRPAMAPGSAPAPRGRITLSLLGQQAEMIRDGSRWVSRYSNALTMRRVGKTWVVADGNGRSFTFSQNPLLVGTGGPFAGDGGLWLLESIQGNGGAVVKLHYEIQSSPLPPAPSGSTPTPSASAPVLRIDLVGLAYNPHPSGACFKHELLLRYGGPAVGTHAQALAVVGDRVLARFHALQSILVTSRTSCAAAPEVLRKYSLAYTIDPDTRQQRLESVKLFGRQGTPVENVALPVATYRYGAATSQRFDSRALRFARTPVTQVGFPQTNPPSLARTEGFSIVLLGAITTSVKSLTDFTGDGLPDLVLRENGALTIRRGLGGHGFGPAAPLNDNTFTHTALDLRISDQARFSDENSLDSYHDYVWTQSLDVNGDGRVDIVDAAAEPMTWVVYLNTPDPGPSGIKWVRRSWDVSRLHALFKQKGLKTVGDHLPLSHRVTGRDHRIFRCWRRQSDGTYARVTCSNPPPAEPADPQQTFVEYQLEDVNGDGYPDVVFDSSPVDWTIASPITEGPGPTVEWPTGNERHVLGPTAAGGRNRILAALNVRGVFLTTATDPFSSAIELTTSQCGVSAWKSTEADDLVQGARCGFADVNGDRIPDRFENGAFWLGTGAGFGTVRIPLPQELSRKFLAVQESAFATACGQSGASISSARQVVGLRDLTGDGIPDLVDRQLAPTLSPPRLRVFIGTGAGFAAEAVDVTGGAGDVTFSTVDESCDGAFSNTTSGLFDVTGDGRPDFLRMAGQDLIVYQLDGGSSPGTPEAGRLIEMSNGYGATTRIGYRSAKHDRATRHQVPFPEIVVTSIQSTGDKGLGGTLSTMRYAYGDIELFYDSMVDAFRSFGYRRRVELVEVPALRGRVTQSATIIDRYGLDVVTPNLLPFLTDAQQFGRYLRAGRVRDVTKLAGTLGFSPSALLTVDATADPRRTGAVHYTVDTHETRLFADPGASSDDCKDVMFPFDFALSSANASAGYDHCSARGFLVTSSMQSWRGTAGPPSLENVQAGTTVRSVDDYGRATSLLYHNDLFRTDDDVCVDITYAAALSPDRPQLHAIALRRVWACGKQRAPLAEEAFEYDQLFPGVVTDGQPTRHRVFRRATDTGAFLGEVRELEASYDNWGNPIELARFKTGATQTTRVSYDVFGLAPEAVEISGTNVATVSTSWARDPISGLLLETKDANGTARSNTFDGFGRPLLDLVAPPGSPAGVLTAWKYLGDDPMAAGGRGLEVKELTDPVSPAEVATTPGRVSTTWFDELGRARSTHVQLGSDYAQETLVVADRRFDLLGRLAFEADPYPASQAATSAYGTSWHFNADGSLAAEVRGAGAQPYTALPSAAVERFATIYRRSYADHTEVSTVQQADALTPGSPQYGVVREARSTAVGRVLSRSTWHGSSRLEHAAFGYDHLGQLSRLIRYGDPATPSNAVVTSWQLDSIGRLLSLSEPASAPQLRTYSDWGELERVEWVPLWPEPRREIVMTHDAHGRILTSEERTGGFSDPSTVNKYRYDVAASTPFAPSTHVVGRLASATSSSSTVVMSYDAFGRVDGRTFTDDTGTHYHELHGFHGDGSRAWIELRLPDNGHKAERVEYGYDSAGRAKTMRFTDGAATSDLFSVDRRDPWGRTRHASYGLFQLDADYAELGRRLPRYVKLAGPQATRSIEYTAFDAVGRELARFESMPNSPGQHIHAYDRLGRLSSTRRMEGANALEQWEFDYDALGNVARLDDQVGTTGARLSYSVVDRDQLCAVAFGGPPGNCNVVHDSLGNVVYEPTPTGYNKLTHFHSGEVRRIENENGVTATFQYDPLGALADLSIRHGTSELQRDRRFGSFIADRARKGAQESSRAISRSFPGPGVTVSRRGANNKWIYEFSEARGTRFTTDASGVLVQDLSYSPFGQVTSRGATAGTTAFTAEQWNQGDALEPFGLSRLGARIYDPRLGRFLSRDPLLVPRTAATTNAYAFAFNDPWNMTDSTGLDPCGSDGLCIWAALSPSGESGSLAAAAFLGMWAAHSLWAGGSEPPMPVSSKSAILTYSAAFDDTLVSLERHSLINHVLGTPVDWDRTIDIAQMGIDLLPAGRAVRAVRWVGNQLIDYFQGEWDEPAELSRPGPRLGSGQDPRVRDKHDDRIGRLFPAGPRKLFYNLFPQDPVGPPIQIVSPDNLRRSSNRYNYVVLPDGTLVIGRKRNHQVGGGHIDLAGGGPVLGAGEVHVVKGEIRSINNKSGHYRPQGPEAQLATEAAFRAVGLDPRGRYRDEYWK